MNLHAKVEVEGVKVSMRGSYLDVLFFKSWKGLNLTDLLKVLKDVW